MTGLYFYDNGWSSRWRSRSAAPRAASSRSPTSTGRYLECGELNVELLGRGTAWLDTGTHESLLQASNFVQVVEQRQGLSGSPAPRRWPGGWASSTTTTCAGSRSRSPSPGTASTCSGCWSSRMTTRHPGHRRLRLHRLHLRTAGARGAPRLGGRQPRQAHLRRPSREPPATSPATRATASCAATSATRRRYARRWPAARWRSTSPPRPTSTARCSAPTHFIDTDIKGVCGAARGGAPGGRRPLRPDLHRRGLRLDRGRLVHRGEPAQPAQPLLRLEGGRRPARATPTGRPTACR